MATDKATTLRMLAGVPLDKSYEHTITGKAKPRKSTAFFLRLRKAITA